MTKEITEDEFYETFKPQKNHINDCASFDDCMYETYDEELDYVFNLAKTTKKVWTIIEGDDETLYFTSGFHYVNRIGFLVCEVEYTEELEIKLDTEF